MGVEATLHRLSAFIRLGRPMFLIGGLVYHALGAAIAHYEGVPLNPLALLLGQIAITAVQWMTHYSNDYFDLPADRLNQRRTRWAGSSGVLPAGELPPPVALVAAQVWAGIGLLMLPVLAIAVHARPITLILIAGGMALAWFYSAPPPRLNWRGLGEVTVALVVPGLTPLVGYSLQAGRISWLALLAVVPSMLLQVASQINLNAFDAPGDAVAGKLTLVVRQGVERAARLHNLALILAFGSLPLLVWIGLPAQAAGWVAALGVIGMWQAWRVGRGAYHKPGQWDTLGFFGLGLPIGAALVQIAVYAGVVEWVVGWVDVTLF